jgi:hypothetical protein
METSDLLRQQVAHYWREEVRRCQQCWDDTGNPVLKEQRGGARFARAVEWRNRHRVPHIGVEFEKAFPRIVLMGLEDHTTDPSSDDPIRDMNNLNECLIGQLRSDDRHRHGEFSIIEDLLGEPAGSLRGQAFRRVATLNSRLCSLVFGSRKSASHKLAHECPYSWRTVFTLLRPDILVVEGKGLLWREAEQQVLKLGTATQINLGVTGDKARLYQIDLPNRG